MPAKQHVRPLLGIRPRPADAERLANLTGPFDAHLRLIELRLGVEIANRGNIFRITGTQGRGRPHRAVAAATCGTTPRTKP